MFNKIQIFVIMFDTQAAKETDLDISIFVVGTTTTFAQIKIIVDLFGSAQPTQTLTINVQVF